jgi:hypothetical protein
VVSHRVLYEGVMWECSDCNNKINGKSLIDPLTIGGGLVYPLNYETV